jgi:malonyl-CoA/methylmalonyl-CoA synthetase
MLRASTGCSPCPPIEINEDLILAPTTPCLIIFTSGTTGRPKGAVIPRRRFLFKLPMDYGSVYLAYRPVHWMGGAGPPIFRLLQGGKIHFMKRRPSPAAFWELYKEGKITTISLAPAVFKDLQDDYLIRIRHLPPEEHHQYIAGLSRLRDIKCSGSALDPAVARFWEELTNTPIRNVFGSTELGGITTTRATRYVNVCSFALALPNPVRAGIANSVTFRGVSAHPFKASASNSPMETKARFSSRVPGCSRSKDYIMPVAPSWSTEA